MAPTSKKKNIDKSNTHKPQRTVKNPSVTYFLRSRSKAKSVSSPLETDANPVQVEPVDSVPSTTSVTSVEMASTSNTISFVPENESSIPLSFPSSVSLEYSLESSYEISMPVLHSTLSASVSSVASNETTSVNVTLTPFNYGEVVSASDMASISGNSVGNSSRNIHLFSEKNENSLCSRPLSSSMSVIETLTSEASSSTSVSPTKSPTIESSVSTGNNTSCAKLLAVNSESSASASKLRINRSRKAKLSKVKVKSSCVKAQSCVKTRSSSIKTRSSSIKTRSSSIKTRSSSIKTRSSTVKKKLTNTNVKKSSHRGKSFSSSKLSQRCITNKSSYPTSSTLKGKSIICSTKLPVVNEQPIPSTSKVPSNLCSEIKPSALKGKSTNYNNNLHTSGDQSIASISKLPMDTSSKTESSTSSSKRSESPNKAGAVSCTSAASTSNSNSNICRTELPVVSDQPIPSTSKVSSDSSIETSFSKGKLNNYKDKLCSASAQPISPTIKVPSSPSSEIKPSTSYGEVEEYRDKFRVSSSKPIASTLLDTDSSSSSSSDTESTSSETNTPKKKDSSVPPVEPWVVDFFKPRIMETKRQYMKRVSRKPPIEPLPPPTTRLFKLLQGRELGQISNSYFPQNFMHTRVTSYSKKRSFGFMNEDATHTIYFLRAGETAFVAVWFLISSRGLSRRAVGQFAYDMKQNLPGRIAYITTPKVINDACQINSESFACIGTDPNQHVGVLLIATPGPPDSNLYAFQEFPHIRGRGYGFNCCNSNGFTQQIAVGCDKELFFYNINGIKKHLIVNDNIVGLAFNHAGNILYYTCDNGEMVTYDMVTGVSGHRAKVDNEIIDEVLVLRDENYCIVSGPTGCLSRVDNRMNRVVLKYPGHCTLGQKVPLSVHNRFGLLSCTGADDVTRGWSLGTGRPLFSFRGPTTYSSRSCLVPRTQKGSIYLVQDDIIHIYSTVN